MKANGKKTRENYFKFPEWNGDRNILRAACRAYMESGKKHRGARMRIVDGYYSVRYWNDIHHKWGWSPIVDVAG